MVSKGQRYATIFSFSLIGVLLLYLCDDLSIALFLALERATGSTLSIAMDQPLGIFCAIFFLLHYGFMYIELALPSLLTALAIVIILMIMIDISRYRKLTIMMGLSIISMVFVIWYGRTNSIWALAIALGIGIILFDQTYFLQCTYDRPYSIVGLTSDYIALFDGYRIKGNSDIDVFYHRCGNTSSALKAKLMGLYFLLNLVDIFSIGLLYGLTTHLRLKWSASYYAVDGRTIHYTGKWGKWFIKGIKWWLFTVFTLGLYFLLGFTKLDQYTTTIHDFHFDTDQPDTSFFDGTMMDYAWIHGCGMVITIVSFGLLYPFYQSISDHYLINHSVIDGYRLIDTASLSMNFKQWIWRYPLLIITIGLFSGFDRVLRINWLNHRIRVDSDPLIYSQDEMVLTIDPSLERRLNP